MRISFAWVLLLVAATSVLFTSCQKEISIELGSPNGGNGNGNGNTNDITGDWDYLGMTAHTSSSVSVTAGTDQLKTVTVSDYVTKNNTGTIKITASQFISTDIGYSIDTMMNVKTYLNGVLFDDTDMPFAVTTPLTSSTSPYVRNTNDSITVTGAFGAPSSPGGSIPTGPVGVRLAWSGDTLLLKVVTSFTQSISQGGVPATMNASVIGVTKLKRK